MNKKVNAVIDRQLSKNEAVLIMPVKMADGEPGDPFKEPIKKLIRGMASAGYEPVDFGEADDANIELCFLKSRSAVKSAEEFIRNGGCPPAFTRS